MRAPIGWALPALAGAAVAVALLAGRNLVVAIPAAALAVVIASLAFASAWSERAEAPADAPVAARTDTDRLRLAFRSGRIGREEIVVTLHRLERTFRDAGLPPPTVAEMGRVAALPPDEFLQFVRERLDRLEAGG
jgi:hypothetical protein